MPKITDLGGTLIGNSWTVLTAAPSVNRIRHWSVEHHGCGVAVALPHGMLMRARDGKGSLPHCQTCAPRSGIDMGMHGTSAGEPLHPVGAPCAAAERDLGSCLPTCGEKLDAFGWALDLIDPDPDPAPERFGPGWAEKAAALATDRPKLEPAAEAIQTAGVVSYGKAEAIEEAQDYLEVIRAATGWDAKPGKGTAGMSNLGGCERKLGYRLIFGTPAGSAAWRAYVGTSVHAALDRDFSHDPSEHGWKWLTGTKLTHPAWGEIDLYNRETKTVLDFKIPGITKVREVYRGRISEQYETQLDLYGLGFEERGFAVERVAILALPSAGEIADAGWYSRPYDRSRAEAAIARRDRINSLHETLGDGAKVLELLTITEDNCSYCPVRAAEMCQGVGIKETKPAPIQGWAQEVATPPGVTSTTSAGGAA